MSERSVSRALLRFTALTTAAVLAFGGSAATASAQDEPTSTAPTRSETTTPPPPAETSAPSETTTPSSTPSEPPPSEPTEKPEPTAKPEPVEAPSETATPPSSDAQPPAVQPQAEQKAEQKAEQAAATPDLKLTVDFDRDEYELGKPLAITVTVRNSGTAPANQVRFASEPGEMWLTTGVDELVSRPSLAPGETKTIKLGATAQYNSTQVRLSMRTYAEGTIDPTPNDNYATDTARIAVNGGMATGVVYEDKNGNGVADAGEGLAHKQLKLTGATYLPFPTFFTDQNGRFWISGLPAGTYQARLGSNDISGQQLKAGQTIVVRSGQTTETALVTAPPLSRSLRLSGYRFDKPKYAKGEQLAVSVTLTNSGTAPIEHLVWVCDPENDPTVLDGTGPGWAEVSPDGQGISIPAGQSRTVTVTDVVPDAAFQAGKVYFACAFSVDGRNVDVPSGGPVAGDPGLTFGAEVVGAFGSVSGWLNRPGNDSVKLIAVDPANGRVLGTTLTGGSYTLPNLRQGPVAIQVVGPWSFSDGSTSKPVTVVGGENVVVDLTVVPGPQVADPSVNAQDLKVSVTFDKATYDFSDPVQMTIKVENAGTGTGPVPGWLLHDWAQGEPSFDHIALPKFLNEHFSLWPGESRQITLTGAIKDYGQNGPVDRIAFKVRVANGWCCDKNPANNEAEASAAVTWATGSATVTVYGDRNLNGQLDAGEELAGSNVNVGGGKPHRNVQGTTGADGRVRFTGLAAGRYNASNRFNNETDWVVADGDPDFVVNPGDEGTAQIRMVRPLSDALKASITFDRPSFRRGERVGLTVSLTNEGTQALQVKAWCYGGSSPYLGNASADWGALAEGAAGVALAPGATQQVHVSTPMPAGAENHGQVATSCLFGPEQAQGNPFVGTSVKVVGETNTFRGVVVTGQYPDQKPVANVKVVLLDPWTNQPVARATTDAEGGWVFPDLPVGPYTPVVVGPWRLLSDWSEGPPFANVKGEEYPAWLWVEPGQEVADPDLATTPGGDGTGAGAGPGAATGGNATALPARNTTALADTGVSVLGLVLFGALLVLAGAALRRKPALG